MLIFSFVELLFTGTESSRLLGRMMPNGMPWEDASEHVHQAALPGVEEGDAARKHGNGDKGAFE